jgi:hypothetical protein
MAGKVGACTTLCHHEFSEFRALNQLDTSVSVILGKLGKVVRDGLVSGVVMIRTSDETTVDWDTHWVIRAVVLVKSAVFFDGLGGVLELSVTIDLSSSEVGLINITEGVGVDVGFSVVEERVTSVGVVCSLHVEVSSPLFIISIPLDSVKVTRYFSSS